MASNAGGESSSDAPEKTGAATAEAREQAAKAAALHGVVPADTSTRIRGHNFAIQLLRVLDGQMDSILTDFARESGLIGKYTSGSNRQETPEDLARAIRAEQELEGGGDPAHGTRLRHASKRPTALRDGPQHAASLERRRKLENFKQRAAVDRAAFIRIMTSRIAGIVGRQRPSGSTRGGVGAAHQAAPSAGGNFTWFAEFNESEIEEELGSVFDATDAGSAGKVTFDTAMAYIVDCALQGDVGYVAEAIPYYGSKGNHFLRGASDVTGARYCVELGKTLSWGKVIGIVDAVASVTFQMEYPKPECLSNAATMAAAGGKHVIDNSTAVYSADYIPHMAAVVVAGSDRALHIVDVVSGLPFFSIPLSEPATLCVFDRTSSTIVCTSRTFVVRCFKVAPHRHTDLKFETTHVFREHSNLVVQLTALGHDGLVASASLDGRIIVMQTKTGAVHTRFMGHQGSAICAMVYVSTFGYMASCSLHSDPRVWIVSAMASRLDCFRLSDSETPHTDRVVSMSHVPGSPQLLTLDRNGMIKVWDLRSFSCVQTLRAERSTSVALRSSVLRWHTVVYDEASKLVIAFSKRRLQTFCPLNMADGVGRTDGKTAATLASCDDFTLSSDLQFAAQPRADIERQRDAAALVERMTKQDEEDDDDVGREAVKSVSTHAARADDFPIVAIALNLENSTCLTASDRKVRLWDAFTGKLEVRFDRLAGLTLDNARITAACVSTSGRSFMLGFRNGRIAIHAYSTGALLHVLVEGGSDTPEVTRLTYLHGASAFIASSAEGCRLFLDKASYDDGLGASWPDETRGYGAKSLSYDPVMSLLAVGYKGGSVRVMEGRRHRFTTGSVRPIATYNSFTTHDVEALCILSGYPVMAVADSVGQVLLVTLPPHAFAGRVFAKLTLRQRIAKRMLFHAPRRVLYIATDTGTLIAVDIATALQMVNIRGACGSWESMMSSAGRSGAQPRWIEELVPRRVVQAHSDAIVDLVQAPGAGLLLTASADRSILAWTLALFFRGEFDNTSTFGRYIATVARPVDPHVTGVQAYRDAQTGTALAPVSDQVVEQARAVARCIDERVSEDDWDEMPRLLESARAGDGQSEGESDDEYESVPDAVIDSLAATPAVQTPQLGRSPGSRGRSPARSDQDAGGLGLSDVAAPMLALSEEAPSSAADANGAASSQHPAVRSMPRAQPHRVVGARRQKISVDRSLLPAAVVETAADDEAAFKFHDALRSFLPKDVSTDLERRRKMTDDERLEEDAKEKRGIGQSAAKAAALLIDAPMPVLDPDLPADLPSTVQRHTRPAIAGPLAPDRDRSPKKVPKDPAEHRLAAVERGVHQERALAILPLLSCNSTGVDYHTVLAFGPSDPKARVPKAFVVETAESAGAQGGEAFAVTQDRPNDPHAREARDFEIKRIMDAEDAKREAADATRRLEESVLALATSNHEENLAHLDSRTFGTPLAHQTVSPSVLSELNLPGALSSSFVGPVPGLEDIALSAEGSTHDLPTTAIKNGEAHEVLDWGVGSPDRNAPATAPLPAEVDHLSRNAAQHVAEAQKASRAQNREAKRRDRRLLPAELLKQRQSQSRSRSRLQRAAATPAPAGASSSALVRGGHRPLDRRAATPSIAGTPSAAEGLPPRTAPEHVTQARAVTSMAQRGGGTALRGNLPPPVAGRYSCFMGCESVEPPDEPGSLGGMDGTISQGGPSAAPDSRLVADPDVEELTSYLPALASPPIAPEDMDTQTVTERRVDSKPSGPTSFVTPSTGKVPPVIRRALRRAEASLSRAASLQPDDQLAFTTLGVRRIPVASAPEQVDRPATTPALPDVDEKRRQQGKKSGGGPLWVKTHRV